MIPKFRVWDKENKMMWNIERWHIEDEYFDLIEPNKSVIDFKANRTWRKQSDVTLMQSTGLFDKNDKEIFEGDILKCTSIDGRLWHETNVSWDSTIAGFVIHKNIYEATSIGYLTDSKSITVEIIGNIYENPESLEVE